MIFFAEENRFPSKVLTEKLLGLRHQRMGCIVEMWVHPVTRYQESQNARIQHAFWDPG
jgi:hypothetical protein